MRMICGYIEVGFRWNAARISRSMRCMRTARALRCVVTFLVGTMGAAWGAPAKSDLAALDRGWRHYASPNFELYSTAAERESRALLHNLELLRAVFFDRFRLIERTRLGLTVFLFDKDEDFAGYAPTWKPVAFYLAHPDRAIIAVGPTMGPRAPVTAGPVTIEYHTTPPEHLIFHEYVHHLFRATNQHPTVWFGEGVAELLATIRVQRDRLEMGHANAPTLLLLQNNPLLPFEQIFGASHTSPLYRGHSMTGMFYAQSWVLLHYLHFGESGLPREGTARFARVMGDRKLAAEVRDMPAFFRECFGIDYAEMQKRLDRYVGNGKYRPRTQPLPQLPPAAGYAMRAVPREEARLRLAELAWRVRRSPEAKLALLDAQEKEPRVLEVLGTVALAENDADRARERWERALELGSRNDAVVREVALLESRRWLAQFDFDFRLPPETAQRLRARLLHSIKAEPAQSASYEMLALVEAFAAEPQVENVNLVQQHFRQLTEKPRTVVALAMVRVRLGKPDEARVLLDELARLPPEPNAAKMAEVIRARLGAAEVAAKR